MEAIGNCNKILQYKGPYQLPPRVDVRLAFEFDSLYVGVEVSLGLRLNSGGVIIKVSVR